MATPVSKEQVLKQIEVLSPTDLAEVSRYIEFLQYLERQTKAIKGKLVKSSAFGIWRDYPEAQDPVVFARKLCQNIELRLDG